MFLTNYNMARQGKIQKKGGSQSPQIGSMFLTESISKSISKLEKRRNPLKSGQCFLQSISKNISKLEKSLKVAIPSNRVNVSYIEQGLIEK